MVSEKSKKVDVVCTGNLANKPLMMINSNIYLQEIRLEVNSRHLCIHVPVNLSQAATLSLLVNALLNSSRLAILGCLSWIFCCLVFWLDRDATSDLPIPAPFTRFPVDPILPAAADDEDENPLEILLFPRQLIDSQTRNLKKVFIWLKVKELIFFWPKNNWIIFTFLIPFISSRLVWFGSKEWELRRGDISFWQMKSNKADLDTEFCVSMCAHLIKENLGFRDVSRRRRKSYERFAPYNMIPKSANPYYRKDQ